MSTPTQLARFIQQQRDEVVKSAAPRFEEIKDNAVTISRDTPTFDNATVAELRRDVGNNAAPAEGDVTQNINPSGTLNPKPTEKNQANPNVNIVEKSANVQNIINAVRANFGLTPAVKQAATPALAAPLAPTDLSNDVLAKVASVMLSTEEGCRVVECLMEKACGAKDAAEFLKAALAEKDFVDTLEMNKAAAVSTTLNRAAQIEASLRQHGLTEEDAFICIKQAAIHEHNLGLLDHPMLKQAYAEGADDQAAMEQGLEQGGEPEIPMGGDQMSDEEIIQILQSMIESGQISKEEVEAALAQISGQEGGAPGADPAQEGGAPAQEAPVQ